jgi:UDP-2,3-diacylglucosamine pyrophosphatase LpxH
MLKSPYHNLEDLYQESPVFPIQKKDRFVIFSDLHMGNGSSTDDFIPNSDLFASVLRNFYLEKDYQLILNGDVEELQRFSYQSIQERWKNIYHIFDKFADNGGMYKIVGNHDIGLLSNEIQSRYPVYRAIRFMLKNQEIFIFHGHQATRSYSLKNALIGYTLRYLANPLGIKNYSVSHSSRKQYKIEKNVYEFSNRKKVVSLIGHTHRPLFESLPKSIRIKFRIEQLCREYSAREPEEALRIRKVINIYKKELYKLHENGFHLDEGNLYNTRLHIPCLFNSGCVIGKRGMTCLEIVNGKIRLVHWFDKKISNKYLKHSGYTPEQLGASDYYRMLLNKEKLNYVFNRIQLLS